MKSYLHRIKQSKNLQLLLFSGFVIQLIFCFVSVGYFHPDQHFQVIEFSSYQLKEPNAANSVWELARHIRPTLQVYMFSAFRLSCNMISIDDPFTQLLLLRLLLGVSCLAAFNLIAFYYCKRKSDEVLIITLLLINCSWFLPYSRTLFSAEMVSAVVFFPALTFFHHRFTAKTSGNAVAVLTGFLFALSFFLRFQLAFSLLGFALWIIVFERQFKAAIFIFIGFMTGVTVNVLLDYYFYHEAVFTPYLYFKVNIMEGMAASFGEQNFTYYLAVLAGLIGVPFISIVLLYHYVKTSLQKFRHPLVLTTLFFIAGLFMVGHKEERFMFTIINIVPIVIALNVDSYSFLSPAFKWKKLIQPVIIFSAGLNIILLVLFILTPYSQTIRFDEMLSNRFYSGKENVYCYQRTPLETESHLPLTFYKNGLAHIDFTSSNNFDFLMRLPSRPVWLSGTFNDMKDHFKTIDSLGYKPQFYSSSMLWNLNSFLLTKKINTINDIWVLYRRE